jgi:general stress protein CsbA
MTFGVLTIQPLVALVAGILILIAPRLLNYVVAIYLIIIGVLGLWPGLFAGTGAS